MLLSPRWQKILRDIRNNKTKTVLVVLSIAVGVFAFASVFITREMLFTEMDAQTRLNNPTTIRLYVNSTDDSLSAWARRQPEVADAQLRARRFLKIVTPEQTYNTYLYVYEDYENITMNRLFPEKGDWPPQRREIWLERTSFERLGIAIGDTVTIEMQDGSRQQLTVAGSLYDVDAIPFNISPELTGYVTMPTMGWLGMPDAYNRLEIIAESEYDTIDKLEVVAQDLKERLRQAGFNVSTSTFIGEPGEHWAKDVTESFTLILSFVGIFSLALSGFLVVNTMSALMMEQQRQVGMMKAIGGSSRQIIGIYLALVAVYGLLALMVAVPAGLGLSYVFTRTVADFINIDILNFHLPASILILQIIAAIIIPVIAAAIPIRSGIRVSVAEAIGNHGIKVKDSHGWLDRLALRVNMLPRPLRLSLRNTFRRKGRLLLTLCTLTLAGALFIGVINVRTSLTAELDRILDTLFNYEVNISLNGLYSARGVQNRVETVDGVIKTGGSTAVSGQRVEPDGAESDAFPILGISADDDFVQPEMVSGRWFTESDRNGLVLSTNLLEDMPDVEPGDYLTVKIGDKEYEWQVTGIMLMGLDRVAYTNFDYLSALRGYSGMASSVYVRTGPKDSASQERIAAAIERKLQNANVEVSSTITKDAIVSANASQFDFLIGFLLSMAAMVALIGGLGLAGMMGLSVIERTREIGVMRSIGASNLAIGGIVVAEGLLIGLLSWFLSLPFSLPLTLAFNALMGDLIIDQPLIFTYAVSGPVIWLAIVLVIAVFASLLPAFRAVRMSVRETLAYE